jgi:nicotinamidase-related amidase
MTDPMTLPRSPMMMSRDDTALVVVDMQEKLLPHISGHKRIAWNVGRLIDGAKVLDVPVLATEQYPQGLGPTVAEIADRLSNIPSKLRFSCGGCPELFEPLPDLGIYKLLLAGIEAHVCVQQTVLDLLTHGFQVFVAADAVGSRFDVDLNTALRRMESAGASVTTAEAALFEWCEVAGTPEFRQISALVRQDPPSDA